MKIYCLTCREACLRTSNRFKPGGPYTGDMFASLKNCTRYADDFYFQDWVNSGNLWCPRCLQEFVQGGVLLTEHGKIRIGQKTIDRSVSIVHKGGELDGLLKSTDVWNQPENSFVCKVCGKGFSHRIALAGHERRRSHK